MCLKISAEVVWQKMAFIENALKKKSESYSVFIKVDMFMRIFFFHLSKKKNLYSFRAGVREYLFLFEVL